MIASGDPVGPPAAPPGVVDPGRRRLLFVFDAARPARYLACVISRFTIDRSPADRARGRPTTAAGRARPPVGRPVADRPRQSPAGRTRPREERGRGRDHPVLRLDPRRRAVSEFHARHHRVRSPGRAQSAVLRRPQPGRLDEHRLAQRSGELRQLPDVLSRARDRASVVGPRRRVEELPRAVDQRGVRAVLRRALRRAVARRPGLRAVCSGRCARPRSRPRREGPVYLGYRLGHIQAGRSDLPGGRLQQGRDGAAHAPAARSATARSSRGCGRSTRSGSSRRPAPTTSARRWNAPRGRDLRRFFETWIYGAAIPRVRFDYRIAGQDAQLRFEQLDDPVDVALTVTVSYANGVLRGHDRAARRARPPSGRSR